MDFKSFIYLSIYLYISYCNYLWSDWSYIVLDVPPLGGGGGGVAVKHNYINLYPSIPEVRALESPELLYTAPVPEPWNLQFPGPGTTRAPLYLQFLGPGISSSRALEPPELFYTSSTRALEPPELLYISSSRALEPAELLYISSSGALESPVPGP